MYKPFLLIVLVYTLSACSSSGYTGRQHESVVDTTKLFSENSQNQLFYDSYQEWKGTPYRFGGQNKQGVDCSAFVQSVFWQALEKSLPRTTEHQSKVGYKVSLAEADSGDLVFFKTSFKSRHVGIYLGELHFMHASTSKGVIISRLDNPYWSSVFWQIRRIN